MGWQPLQQTTYQYRKVPARNRSNFAICPLFTPIIDYITATKHITDLNGENNLFVKTDCAEYYAKVKDILTKIHSLTSPTKEERRALHSLRKYDSLIVLTADKGVASVIIYMEKCMALFNNEEV